MKKKKPKWQKLVPVDINLSVKDHNNLKKLAKKSKLSISSIVEAFIILAILKEKCPKEMKYVG